MTPRPDVLKVYRDEAGGWRWTLTAPNGRTIGASTEAYSRRLWCVRNATRVVGLLSYQAAYIEREGTYLEVYRA